MDDFHGGGPEEAAAAFLAKLRTVFDLKATEVFLEGRYSRLRRDRLRMNNITMIRGNTNHVDKLIELLEIKNAKTAKIPSVTESDPGDGKKDETPTALDEEEAKGYRRGVGLLLYLACDRWDVKRGTELMARRLKEPREFDRRRTIKVIRYLKGKREYGHVLKRRQEKTGNISLDMF